MTFDEYQLEAITTKMYKLETALFYLGLGLVGEAGEVAEKIKKVIRDNNSIITEEKKIELSKELGDVLWYVTALADELGISLNSVAEGNILKLQSRKDRGVLSGSGDNR